MRINLKVICLATLGLILSKAASTAARNCGHNGPRQRGDPNPDPNRSHKRNCCDTYVLLACPCPSCPARFGNSVYLQNHILEEHGDCRYARGEAFGERGSSIDAEEPCEYHRRMEMEDSDFEGEKSYSSGSEDPQDRFCKIGICHHKNHETPRYLALNTKALAAAIQRIHDNIPSPPRVQEHHHPQGTQQGGHPHDRPSTSRDITISRPCPPPATVRIYRRQGQQATATCSSGQVQTNQNTEGNFCYVETDLDSPNKGQLICIDLTNDNNPDVITVPSDDEDVIEVPPHDDSIEIIHQDDNSVIILDDLDQQQIQQPPEQGAGDETVVIPSDEEDEPISGNKGKGKGKGKSSYRTSSAATTGDAWKDHFHSSTTPGTGGFGQGIITNPAAVGGLVCQLIAASATSKHRHPRSLDDILHEPHLSGEAYWTALSEATEDMMAANPMAKQLPPSVTWSCEAIRPRPSQRVRDDLRCGPAWLTASGLPGECPPDNPEKHCCSPWGWCGTGRRYCSKPGSRDFADYSDKIRSDGKCGFDNYTPGHILAICDPVSDAPCCSNYGHCGGTSEHCLGTDFRKVKAFTKKTRADRFCGRPHRAPDSGFAICPDNECCSLFNFCGRGDRYCYRGTNFTSMSPQELEKFRFK